MKEYKEDNEGLKAKVRRDQEVAHHIITGLRRLNQNLEEALKQSKLECSGLVEEKRKLQSQVEMLKNLSSDVSARLKLESQKGEQM